MTEATQDALEALSIKERGCKGAAEANNDEDRQALLVKEISSSLDHEDTGSRLNSRRTAILEGANNFSTEEEEEEDGIRESQQVTPPSKAESCFSPTTGTDALKTSNSFNLPKSPSLLTTDAETPFMVEHSSGPGHSIIMESTTIESDSIEEPSQLSQMEEISEHDDIEYQDFPQDDTPSENDFSKENALDEMTDSSSPPLNPENDSTAPTARPGLMRTPSGKMIMGNSHRLSLTVDLETGKEGGSRGQCAVVSYFGGEAVAP